MSQEIKHYPCYINGEWLDSSTREKILVESPANNEVFATVTANTIEDVRSALETSEQAQPTWQSLPAQTRANYIYAVVDRLRAETNHFARLLVTEQGKTYGEAGVYL